MRLLTSREQILSHPGAGEPRPSSRRPSPDSRKRAEAADPDSPLARSLWATLSIQEKRLENLEAAADNLAVVDAELERIEQQVRLIREESAVSGGPEMLSARLDAVSNTLTETSQWMDQHADLLGPEDAGEVRDGSAADACRRPPAEEPPPVPRPPRKRQREG